MSNRAVPMIHVPDVSAAVEWYTKIGFKVVRTYGDDGDGLSFAILSFGTSEVMFNEGGGSSESKRREIDLYIYTEDVDGLYQRLQNSVDVIEKPNDRFYGNREFVLRDLNGFWITFAEESHFAKLMSAIEEGDEEKVRQLLQGDQPKKETLNAALAAANKAEARSPVIAELLKKAGATPAANVDTDLLQSYVGQYSKDEFEVNVTLEDGELFAAPGRQQALRLLAIDKTTFTPIDFDNFGTITFNIEGEKVIGCTLTVGPEKFHLQRVERA